MADLRNDAPSSAALLALLTGAAEAADALSASDLAAALGEAWPGAVSLETAYSLEDLGQLLEDGLEVVLLVDAGVLWDWPAASGDGAHNHAVLVLEAQRDEVTGAVVAARLADPARPDAAVAVDEPTLVDAWLVCGGRMISLRREA